MSQSLSRVVIHAIWSTKERARLIDDSHRPELHRYLAGTFAELSSPVIEVNSEPDHIHVLFGLARTASIAGLLNKVKSASSALMKRAPSAVADFAWQGGYAAFSVSATQEAIVRKYIQNQREHHATQSFQDELRAILRRHEVDFDERYLWD